MSDEKLLNILAAARTMLADHGHVTICQALTQAIKDMTLKGADGMPPQPPQQESATVCEMRQFVDDEFTASTATINRWANELEQNARNLAAEPFTDGPRQPAPSREVDWEAMGLVAFQMHKTSRNSNWYELSEYSREEWRSVAKAVVAAYEKSKENSGGD